MALQQHFGYTSRTSEVAINLEWGMCVKEIGIGSATLFDSAEYQEGVGSQCELVFDEFVSMVTIQQSCP